MKKLFFYILIFLISLVSIFSVLGYLGWNNWEFDLFSNFKPQYLIILSIGTLLVFIIRKRVAYFFLPFIAFSAFDVMPLYFGGNKTSDITNSTRIVSINLLNSNDKFEEVEHYILNKSADIVVFEEFTTLWQFLLEQKLNEYKYRLTIPRDDGFGIAVYSKIAFSELKELKTGSAGVPSISGVFKVNNSITTLLATHLLPPVGSDYFKQRNTQLSDLVRIVSKTKNEIVLIGDLNTSSFTIHFKDFLKNSKLKDSRKGFGILTTWPTWFKLAQTTLDHCLVSEGLLVKLREVGFDVGSDHLPIFVEIGIK